MPRPRVKPVIEVDGKLWMTVDEVSRRQAVSRGTVYEWFKRGLPSKKIGRVRRINVSALSKWRREQELIEEEVTSASTQAPTEEAINRAADREFEAQYGQIRDDAGQADAGG